MKYKNIFITITLLYIVMCAGPLFAQEFQTIPISPVTRSSQQSSAIEKKQPPQQSLQSSEQGGQGLKPELLPAENPSEAPSEFEEYIAGKLSLTVSTNLKQFGYDLFNRPPSTFAPVGNVPVGPGYVIGPGDEIKVSIWGRVEGQWDVVVDRDGNISIPKIGTLGVSGLKFSELRKLLHKQFSKYYRVFEMNVSMGSLRTIRVYVVGNARYPGSYTLSSLSTLINALFEAGGPNKTGTMRAIQVKRNGKTVVRFDMYDFLLKGDKTRDIRLMPEDVIFIQPVGPLVAIAGSVNNPAIYELKGRTTISQLIEMAGGLSDVAFKGRVQIERIIDHSRQIVFESDLQKIRDKDIAVQAGDVVKIFQVVKDERIVKLAGAVQREGEYGFSPPMTVRDLISMAGGLKYYAYDKEAELTRIHITNEGPVTEKIMVNLGKALAGDPDSNIHLQENDYLFVRAIPEWRLYQTVVIEGEVRFPGTYTIKRGERLSSLIERAGGFTDKAFLKGAVFTRKRIEALQQQQIEEMIDRLERELMSTGTVRIATAASSKEARLMQIETDQKRQFIAKLRTIKAKGRVAIRMELPDKLRGTIYDIELEDNDSIYIPTDPQTVQVIGSVYNQTAFIYEKGRNSKFYISLAGGYTDNADSANVYILKANGSAMKSSRGFTGLSWNSEYSRWDIGAGQVDSGDTIVVPEKLEGIAWMRNIKDITQILYQIAVTSGVLIATF
ncbi:MAG TPA: polysaccharide export protein [Nitrospirae bacterium]|nr:polysaccharide export protein [Nitrospirota bacterium]